MPEHKRFFSSFPLTIDVQETACMQLSNAPQGKVGPHFQRDQLAKGIGMALGKLAKCPAADAMSACRLASYFNLPPVSPRTTPTTIFLKGLKLAREVLFLYRLEHHDYQRNEIVAFCQVRAQVMLKIMKGRMKKEIAHFAKIWLCTVTLWQSIPKA